MILRSLCIRFNDIRDSSPLFELRHRFEFFSGCDRCQDTTECHRITLVTFTIPSGLAVRFFCIAYSWVFSIAILECHTPDDEQQREQERERERGMNIRRWRILHRFWVRLSRRLSWSEKYETASGSQHRDATIRSRNVFERCTIKATTSGVNAVNARIVVLHLVVSRNLFPFEPKIAFNYTGSYRLTV